MHDALVVHGVRGGAHLERVPGHKAGANDGHVHPFQTLGQRGGVGCERGSRERVCTRAQSSIIAARCRLSRCRLSWEKKKKKLGSGMDNVFEWSTSKSSMFFVVGGDARDAT